VHYLGRAECAEMTRWLKIALHPVQADGARLVNERKRVGVAH
jgi:hypothetical protein